ncbi:hydrogenase 3 maturation endopeptidase HyCI [Candidatus Bathyarchaeota archaeon]|nr:hydrogenase 3 maturation endopeptidase HyCI [Candidatus Bathyarchaeota archaeon]
MSCWRLILVKSEYNIHAALEKWFADAERVVVAGIGNPIRRDDFVGVKIVQDLEERVSDKVSLLECETVPESFMQEIVDIKPSHVLLIDAAILGLKPGEIRLIYPEQVSDFPAITTHVLPLRIFCEYIAKMIKTKIALLLIEPENTDFGEGLTPITQDVAKKVVTVLRKLLREID